MKKQIRLLVENLFDDLYDIDQETNYDIDLADNVYYYDIGDFIYRNKKLYAICCGSKNDFQDNESRFILYEKLSGKIYAKVPSYLEILGKKTETDENGFNNTQIIKNEYYVKSFPAFEYCCKFGDDVYLPAIHELKVLYDNYDILIKIISKIPKPKLILLHSKLISSSQVDANNCFVLTEENHISKQDKMIWGLVHPFVKI